MQFEKGRSAGSRRAIPSVNVSSSIPFSASQRSSFPRTTHSPLHSLLRARYLQQNLLKCFAYKILGMVPSCRVDLTGATNRYPRRGTVLSRPQWNPHEVRPGRRSNPYNLPGVQPKVRLKAAI